MTRSFPRGERSAHIHLLLRNRGGALEGPPPLVISKHARSLSVGNLDGKVSVVGFTNCERHSR